MQNVFHSRTAGHLFEEAVWVLYNGRNTQAVVVADDMRRATVVRSGNPSDVLLSGRLEFRKGTESGTKTRVLVFVANGTGQEVIVSENVLSGQRSL